MPKIHLTDTGLRSLPVPPKGQTDFWDSSFKAGAFACRVSQGGTRTFLVKHKNRRVTIGQFPTISLSEARTEAKRLLAEFTLGKVRPQSITYKQAVELFLEEKGKERSARTVSDYRRLLLRPNFQGQLSDITHEEVARRLKRFTARGEYNHILVALKVFFNWCVKRRYTEFNPTLGFSQHYTQPRARVLSDAELQLIWRACGQSGRLLVDAEGGASPLASEQHRREHAIAASSNLAPPSLPANFATIVRLLIATGQRRGEIAGLRTDNIDLDNNLICLKPEQTKNGREHTFPISSLTNTILKSSWPISSGLLFPARGSTAKPFNGWSKSKNALDKLSGVSDWTLHDLRRTYRTTLGRLGVAPHIAERLVNHISSQSQMERTYDHYRYLPEFREAVKLHDDHLQKLLNS